MSYIQSSTGSRNRVVGHTTVFYGSDAGTSLSRNFCVTPCLNLKHLWCPFVVKCTSALPIPASPRSNMAINTLANRKASRIRNSFHAAFDITVFYWCNVPRYLKNQKVWNVQLLSSHFTLSPPKDWCPDFKMGTIPLTQFIEKASPNQHHMC